MDIEFTMTREYPYESVSVDKRLFNKVLECIEETDGYRTASEFIHEAIRLRLGELERIGIEKQKLSFAKTGSIKSSGHGKSKSVGSK